MFLRVVKGIRYNAFLGFKFSNTKAFNSTESLASLISLQNPSINPNFHENALPLLNVIKANIYDLSKDEILNLVAFATSNSLIDTEFSVLISKSFRNMIRNKTLNLTELSIFLPVLLQSEWNNNDMTLLTAFISSQQEKLTPNTISLLLPNVWKLQSIDKSLIATMENKTQTFLPYMNMEQMLQSSRGMANQSNHSSEFWKKVEKKILANFLFLNPKDINDFCTTFFEMGKGSEEFWNTCMDAMEVSASNYENISAFFPFMLLSKKGSPALWVKYEKSLLEKINHISDSDLLENIKFLHEIEKGSTNFWTVINQNLSKRIQKFQLFTCYSYVVDLVPFEKLNLTKELWARLVKKLLKDYTKLDPIFQGNLCHVLKENDKKESMAQNKKNEIKNIQDEDEFEDKAMKFFDEEESDSQDEESTKGKEIEGEDLSEIQENKENKATGFKYQKGGYNLKDKKTGNQEKRSSFTRKNFRNPTEEGKFERKSKEESFNQKREFKSKNLRDRKN